MCTPSENSEDVTAITVLASSLQVDMLTAGDVRAIVSMKHGACGSENQEKIYDEATEETSSSNSVAARPYTSVGLFMTFTA